MRIIAGKLRGRQFKNPSGYRSHPMSEKVRGALFNALGDVSGLTILDAYGGSGALVFEAVSRGAQSATTIEKSVRTYRKVKQSLEMLGLEDQVKATRANVSTWSDNNDGLLFDVVLVDPPYDDIRPNIVEKLARHLKTDGVFVVSWPGSEVAPEFAGLRMIQETRYGDAKLIFFRKI